MFILYIETQMEGNSIRGPSSINGESIGIGQEMRQWENDGKVEYQAQWKRGVSNERKKNRDKPMLLTAGWRSDSGLLHCIARPENQKPWEEVMNNISMSIIHPFPYFIHHLSFNIVHYLSFTIYYSTSTSNHSPFSTYHLLLTILPITASDVFCSFQK